MSLPATGRSWHLASRPHGTPVPENFALREEPVRAPGEGEVLVRNTHLSVDPYMRGRMNDQKSYVPPFALDQPMDGAAIGEVVASEAEGLVPGDLVVHNLGWREYATLPARYSGPVPRDTSRPSVYLGVLGMPGFTAWVGLREIAGLREGDAVFVSGAAGAVGSTAGQLARLMGASRVVGSAGSAAKVELLTTEYGFDAAFDYRAAPVREQLPEAAPDGIDVYFDNVGGDHLEAALTAMRTHGRIVLCGMIAQYNATEPPPGPNNLGLMVGKRLRAQGMIVTDHEASRPEFQKQVTAWVESGELRYRETVVEGLENTPEALLGVLRGDNTGKMIVRL
ncbi:NADP-dependent oxidoreductase [Streptomyces spiramenti]|uniref:NADP-dependent oxidoreductase n=1 Tax=Streptomyces spiramenti TaxID=2720606 RepID=A0ABX1APD5_9ACTN|nr:NADP-dependent oxidoreductase [Streptomyces spiramenti]NJP66528.1 NADP-dependent oxidoreductase [Streptomyces spiramenti]